jgi:pimeloyl-ACP methyl ester carboxylesterase
MFQNNLISQYYRATASENSGTLMTKIKLIICLILIGFLFNCRHVLSSDLDKEKRWADQISDSIMTGKPSWLKADKQRFLGIFTPTQTDKTLGGVILVHGTGVHPNWADVILPLRTELPEFGWATLSIQMPILKNDAKMKEYLPLFPEVTPRFNAAIKFLNSQKITNIVIVSHSFGGQMSVYYLSQNPTNPIKAFVGIGMGSFKLDDKSDIIKTIPKLKLPVLDLYGSRDLVAVINSAKLRKKAATEAGNKNYSQSEIIGADHFFAQMDDSLVSKVKSWLHKNAQISANTKKGK